MTIQRRKPIKRVNAKRKAKNWSRAYGSEERVAFVKSLPCVFVGGSTLCAGVIANHHTATGGRGRKADANTIVPICTFHHLELHQVGANAMQARYDVQLAMEARLTERRWLIASGNRVIVEQLPAPSGGAE